MVYFCPNCGGKIFVRSLGYCTACYEDLPSEISTKNENRSIKIPEKLLKTNSESILFYFEKGPVLKIGEGDFCKLLTKIDGIDLLIKVVEDLELKFEVNGYIRGGSGSVEVDLVITLIDYYNFGFILENNRVYFIADLWLLRSFDLRETLKPILEKCRDEKDKIT